MSPLQPVIGNQRRTPRPPTFVPVGISGLAATAHERRPATGSATGSTGLEYAWSTFDQQLSNSNSNTSTLPNFLAGDSTSEHEREREHEQQQHEHEHEQ